MDDESEAEAACLLNQVKNCLMDLSLNFNNVHFLEHSCFLDLTGLQTRHADILGNDAAEGEIDCNTMDEDNRLRNE